MNDVVRRLLSLEAAIRGRRPESLPPLDVGKILAEWHRLRSEPSAEPGPLDPDIAALSDAEAVDEWRGMARAGR